MQCLNSNLCPNSKARPSTCTRDSLPRFEQGNKFRSVGSIPSALYPLGVTLISSTMYLHMRQHRREPRSKQIGFSRRRCRCTHRRAPSGFRNAEDDGEERADHSLDLQYPKSRKPHVYVAKAAVHLCMRGILSPKFQLRNNMRPTQQSVFLGDRASERAKRPTKMTLQDMMLHPFAFG